MEAEAKTADVGIIVGRFQTDILHPGHLDLLDYVTGRHHKVIVVIGVAGVTGLRENPLDYQARAKMLRQAYPAIETVPVQDMASNKAWSESLDKQITALLAPGQTPLLYGSRDSFVPYYQGRFPTQELRSTEEGWSASAVRERIRKTCGDSQDFRAGVIWASSNRYPAVIPTVDIACFDKDGRLLMARKPGETLWRLPGGFADPTSKSYEDDARRELVEECGSIETDGWFYIGSANIDDWRYKGRDKIRTAVFGCRHIFGAISANDDVEQVAWKDFEAAGGPISFIEQVVLQHREIVVMAIDAFCRENPCE